MKHIISITAVALSLVACAGPLGHNSILHNRSGEYLEARNNHFLAVPSDLSDQKLTRTFYVPNEGSTEGVSQLPPGSLSATINAKR